jgi:hypothetical protein
VTIIPYGKLSISLYYMEKEWKGKYSILQPYTEPVGTAKLCSSPRIISGNQLQGLLEEFFILGMKREKCSWRTFLVYLTP